MMPFEEIRTRCRRTLILAMVMGGLAFVASLALALAAQLISTESVMVAFFGSMMPVAVYSRLAFLVNSATLFALEVGRCEAWAFLPLLAAFVFGLEGTSIQIAVTWIGALAPTTVTIVALYLAGHRLGRLEWAKWERECAVQLMENGGSDGKHVGV